MVERDVVVAKLGLISHAISRIEDVQRRRQTLNPVDAEEIIMLNLQRATQSAIDLAAHVVSSEGWRLPDSLGENFSILAENGVIEEELAAELRRMAGFRNVAVHTYETVDPSVVSRIVGEHLNDLSRLGRDIVAHFDLDI